MKKIFKMSAIIALLILTCEYANASPTNSGAAGVICDIMIIVTGRIGRGIGILVVMGTSFLCFSGAITWQKTVTICAGLAIFFVPGEIAMMMVSAKITNVAGNVGDRTFYASNEYKPQELAAAACSQMFGG